jgi:hypothetical protein
LSGRLLLSPKASLFLTGPVFVMRGLDPHVHLLEKGWIVGAQGVNDALFDGFARR